MAPRPSRPTPALLIRRWSLGETATAQLTAIQSWNALHRSSQACTRQAVPSYWATGSSSNGLGFCTYNPIGGHLMLKTWRARGNRKKKKGKSGMICLKFGCSPYFLMQGKNRPQASVDGLPIAHNEHKWNVTWSLSLTMLASKLQFLNLSKGRGCFWYLPNNVLGQSSMMITSTHMLMGPEICEWGEQGYTQPLPFDHS